MIISGSLTSHVHLTDVGEAKLAQPFAFDPQPQQAFLPSGDERGIPFAVVNNAHLSG